MAGFTDDEIDAIGQLGDEVLEQRRQQAEAARA
jgi:hypothetical protein